LTSSIAHVTIKFVENYKTKFSTMFIGSTPEFEVALYTLLYFVHVKMCVKVFHRTEMQYSFKVGAERVNVMMVTNGKTLVSAAPLFGKA